MQAMETEVKIRVADRHAFEQKLPALGFKRVTARTMERNTLYDVPDRRLRNSRQILRIRQYGSKWVLTHKSVPNDLTEEGPHKNRVETETVVEDGPVLGKIFESLGFAPVFVYEKWRTEWTDQRGHCVLDETPLGVYAELASARASSSRSVTVAFSRIGGIRPGLMPRTSPSMRFRRAFEKRACNGFVTELCFQEIGR
jgi:adenylate cyclase class 2